MTNFGVRSAALGSTAEKQDVEIATAEAIQAGVEALSSSTTVIAVDNKVFDEVQTSYTSSVIACDKYRLVLVRVILGVTLAPGTIKLNLQFSENGASFENYVRGPFGSLIYEDTAGAKNECIEAPVLGSKLRINVVAEGTDATNKFTLTCKLNGIR